MSAEAENDACYAEHLEKRIKELEKSVAELSQALTFANNIIAEADLRPDS